MGLATQPSQLPSSYLTPPKVVVVLARPQPGPNSPTSMSQGFHQGAGLFCFSEGFDRSANQDQQQHQHIAQQSRRDKLRVQGFDASGHPFVPIEDQGDEPAIYESATVGAGNMLSDLFGFPAPGPTAIDLHANQIPGSYHLPLRPAAMTGFSGDWYGTNRQANQQQQHPVTGLNTDSAAAMQLFLMNPPLQPPPPQQQHPRSPSPPPTLHQQHQAFQSFGETPFGGRVVEGQGLSLSLSSSLQQLEMAKADELRVREETLYFNNQQQHPLHLQGVHVQGGSQAHGHGQQLQMGYGGGMGVMNVLRNSKYAKAAQELLEEFCSVGRGQLKGSRARRHHGGSSNTNRNPSSGGGGASSSAGASTSSSKDVPPLSPADRFEHQRKKAKLISMLDEVDRRYSHYCDQMQMVVNSFDSVMGFGAATPYTALARKAMSRHFRCLKDAIAAQLKQTCEVLGEKEGLSSSGITKGETPRLRLLDQSLRQQRAFNHMGMMQEQEAWRPQRGLPERSVNVLRGWLFEHFLHPYPSDADKHLLARQTGLSRNQVANWFINARVRLWKPMVEEMYTQESKEEGEEGESDTNQQTIRAQSPKQQQQQQQGQRPESNAAPESDVASPSTSSISQRNYRFASTSENPPPVLNDGSALIGADVFAAPPDVGQIGDMFRYGAAAAAAASSSALGPAARMRLGAAGDVSLTLGLRHAAGSTPEKSRFSVGDFGGC